jgi:hypothetical protein
MLPNQSSLPSNNLSQGIDRIETLNRAMLAPVSDMEERVQVELEAEILRAIVTARYLKKDLGQIARWNNVPYEVVEAIAQRLAKERGLDLEKAEFDQMCKQVQAIEAIPDQGFREWKLQALAKQYKRSRRELIEAYSKALDAQKPIEPLTISQLRAASSIEHQWLVQGWVPSGVTILMHALGGTGKSLFFYGLAKAIAKGESWNDYPTRAGSVVILQSDEPSHVTQERLSIMGITDDDPLTVFTGWQVEAMPQLEALFARRQQENNPIRFLMVDSITGINKSTAISENDVEYARPVMQLAELAARYDCTIGIVHHSNGYGEARGTKAIHNSVSEVWALTTHNETTGERVLRVQKNRVGRAPGRYLFDFDPTNYAFAYKGEQGEDEGAAATHEKRIELWLNEAEHKGTPYESDELAERLAIPISSVRRALNNLWDKGIIQRDRRNTGKRNYFLYWVGALNVSILDPLVDRSGRSPIDHGNPLTDLVDRRSTKTQKCHLLTNRSTKSLKLK